MLFDAGWRRQENWYTLVIFNTYYCLSTKTLVTWRRLNITKCTLSVSFLLTKKLILHVRFMQLQFIVRLWRVIYFGSIVCFTVTVCGQTNWHYWCLSSHLLAALQCRPTRSSFAKLYRWPKLVERGGTSTVKSLRGLFYCASKFLYNFCKMFPLLY
jgi:hypothetical protein